jgi:hypothetical protein
LAKHTGLRLADRRKNAVDRQVKLGTGKQTYWEIVEQLARQTQSRLALYQPDGMVALTDNQAEHSPTSLHGPFRVTAKWISVKRDFANATRMGILCLEIAWEPRFSPYLIERGRLSFQETPSQKVEVGPKVPTGGAILVTEKIAKEFEVHFPAAARPTLAMHNVAGHFVVTMPIKALEFNFKSPKQSDEFIQEGVRVKVNKLTSDKDWWSVELRVEVPAAGPKFESFQTWLGSNAWLDQCSCQFGRGTGDNKVVLRPDPLRTRIIGNPSTTDVVVRYQFTAKADEGAQKDWQLSCRLPGRMVETTVPFFFKTIELP